jgi:hypothetical protein
MGDDDPKTFERKKRRAEARRAAEAMWKPTPAEVAAENALWEPVLRAVKAKADQIERARKEAEEFERELQEQLEKSETDPPANIESADIAVVDPFRTAALAVPPRSISWSRKVSGGSRRARKSRSLTA